MGGGAPEAGADIHSAAHGESMLEQDNSARRKQQEQGHAVDRH